MENVKKFFRGKSWGFYVSLAGAILLLVTAIIYSVTFGMSEHINLNFEVWVLVVALLGVAFRRTVGVRSDKSVCRSGVVRGRICRFFAFYKHKLYVFVRGIFRGDERRFVLCRIRDYGFRLCFHRDGYDCRLGAFHDRNFHKRKKDGSQAYGGGKQ